MSEVYEVVQAYLEKQYAELPKTELTDYSDDFGNPLNVGEVLEQVRGRTQIGKDILCEVVKEAFRTEREANEVEDRSA